MLKGKSFVLGACRIRTRIPLDKQRHNQIHHITLHWDLFFSYGRKKGTWNRMDTTGWIRFFFFFFLFGSADSRIMTTLFICYGANRRCFLLLSTLLSSGIREKALLRGAIRRIYLEQDRRISHGLFIIQNWFFLWYIWLYHIISLVCFILCFGV